MSIKPMSDVPGISLVGSTVPANTINQPFETKRDYKTTFYSRKLVQPSPYKQ